MPLKWFCCRFRPPRLPKTHPMREHTGFAYISQFLQGSSLDMAKLKKSPAKTTKRVARVEVKSSTKVPDDRHDRVIEPVKGKLGVMIPGMGAVATTFVAGVEAIRKGIAHPI